MTGRGYRFVAPVTRHAADTPLTRMIGRADIVAALAVRLPQQRFITVVGPGGIGKTAVALAVADKLSQSRDDDACFVDLAPVTDPRSCPARWLRRSGWRSCRSALFQA